MKEGGDFWEGWDAFNSYHNTIYAIFIAIWAIFYVENWKRTQAAVNSRWLTKDIQKENKERPEFISVESINETSKKVTKVSVTNVILRKVFIGYPVALFFIGLVMITTWLIR